MATELPLDRDFTVEHDVAAQVTPLVRRVTANNPSMFTFHGTNTYIVGRGEGVAVIDPGPDLPEHVDALLAALEGEQVSHSLVTHTHQDHSPAAKAFKAATGAPTYAFGPHGAGARSDWPFPPAQGGDRDFTPDVRLEDGAVVEGTGWTLEAVYTPGHLSNHHCFALREEGVLFSGDHVMGWSTSVISPPDGDMTDYMASLRRLLERDDRMLLPAHGAPVEDPKALVRAFIAHRQEREQGILDCISQGRGRIPEMVEVMYTDVPKELHNAAGRSVFAHLLHMYETGRVAVAAGALGPDATYRLSQ